MVNGVPQPPLLLLRPHKTPHLVCLNLYSLPLAQMNDRLRHFQLNQAFLIDCLEMATFLTFKSL